MLMARFVLLSAKHGESVPGVSEALRKHDTGCATADDTQLLFVVGRELEGYDQFWDENRCVPNDLQRCIDVYLTVSHFARVAALQTITALRQHRFPRDVAVLIARRVYATREDAYAWLSASSFRSKLQ